MATLEFIIDISLIEKAYKAGLEDGFILANDTLELESELNKNNISDAE